MKTIEQNTQRLVLKEKDYLLKLWGICMPLISVVGLYLVLSDYNPTLEPAIYICCVFLCTGLFVSIFMRKELTYELDKHYNTVHIYYPVRLCTKHDVVTFRMDEVRCISKKKALQSSKTGSKKIYTSCGFDFILNNGRKIHGGIYSSNHKEIERTIETLASFLGVQAEESANRNVLWL